MRNKDKDEELIQMSDDMRKLKEMISECEALREEWRMRIKEAKLSKSTYDTLVKMLREQLNIDEGQ